MTKREILDRMNEVARKPPGDGPDKMDLLMLLQLIKDLAADVRAEEAAAPPAVTVTVAPFTPVDVRWVAD